MLFQLILSKIIRELQLIVKVEIDLLERNTDDLKQELMSTPDLDQFIQNNQAYFIEKGLANYLQEILQKKKISKSSLAKRANISEVYLHQVFAGQRNLSRNRLLCVCIGLSATLDETQNLLQKGGHAQLYAKNKRDTVVMFGLLHRMDLDAINDRLLTVGEVPLC